MAALDELATVVVVPRERFSETRRSLESILAHTPPDLNPVYIDGGSPRATAAYLRNRARERRFRLIRTDQFLAPNQARNIGWRHADTRYVIFVDNDVVVKPGWLDALIRCAEETGAGAVGPIVCIGDPGDDCIHIAAGWLNVNERDGRRELDEHMAHINERVRDVRHSLRRTACDYSEFHCLLARRELFDKIGELDEAIISTREHIDFCLAVRRAGGSVYFEPGVCVTHVPPWRSFSLSDIPYYLLRWNDEWAHDTVKHFVRKWNLADDTDDRLTSWIVPHRRVIFQGIENRFRPALIRNKVGKPLVQAFAEITERILIPLARRKSRAGPGKKILATIP
ncbi:MAG: hypothetical protein A2W18_15190 [Candidatus Muproteobacteria bacterium RBG_16_60_9]|uniref:Glycosyltransferase 2-like domain-containing protein n=1 Tax=Candidatus Muproteobacteria bacterium RBG_16_60_9 TaxID=1817755 RepID=A0A1F6UWB6_9PROT|nr:MAG: hypothetical protein A2W18_15190 [Candidatus Muproteobacteria bacterium RBG_16_60_9]